MTLNQHIFDTHPLVWFVICNPFLGEKHLAMDLLQKYGVIADQTVHMEDVGHSEQLVAVEWLCNKLDLPKRLRPGSVMPSGPKPGKETEPHGNH